jgi:hypothetical protein
MRHLRTSLNLLAERINAKTSRNLWFGPESAVFVVS